MDPASRSAAVHLNRTQTANRVQYGRMEQVVGPYLDYLVARLAAAGGSVQARTLRTLAEATDDAPIVVNCAGLGARELAGDTTVRPVRGQHVVLTNPGITELFMELAAP